MGNYINQLSEKLLLAVKMQENTLELKNTIAYINLNDLFSLLNTDNLKKAFWINIYNAFFQILRKEIKLGKNEIYTKKAIKIAQQNFSLDDIEHSILRRFRYKYSLGYLPNIFTPKLIKKLAVNEIDYRIHFALNCGAKSCPPIAFYTSERIEEQLETATLSFLETETTVNKTSKEIFISRLFLWFKADFGGMAGTRNILEEKLKINTQGFSIKYSKYSWEEDLDNYNF